MTPPRERSAEPRSGALAGIAPSESRSLPTRRSRSRCTVKTRHISILSLLTLLLPAVALALAGCVTKAQADARAREAFAAGERQATARFQQQAQGPHVTFIGEVKNPVIPWTEDLTLAKAIVAAGYYGKTDPTDIVIVRNGQGIQVDPKKLLSGEDVPLLDHDLVTIRR